MSLVTIVLNSYPYTESFNSTPALSEVVHTSPIVSLYFGSPYTNHKIHDKCYFMSCTLYTNMLVITLIAECLSVRLMSARGAIAIS